MESGFIVNGDLVFWQWKSGLLGYEKSGFVGHGKNVCWATGKVVL